MTLTTLYLQTLDREVERSRHALEQFPAGKRDWKPHERSMPLGYLCDIVAGIPSWFAMIVNMPELDIAPVDGPKYKPVPHDTAADFVAALDAAAQQGRAALQATSDEHLAVNWRLLTGGKVAAEMPRFAMLQDTFGHWAHHRGQLTVYLRLLGAKVPALYGPSADDARFA